MKKLLNSFLLLGGLSPFLAYANVNIQLDKNIEAVVIEGEELPLSVLNKSKFTLPNGQNQLVLRVSKLVTKGSEFEKFRSDPVVVTFDAADTTINIKPARDIRFEREVKEYKSNVNFILETQTEAPVIAKQAILPRGSGFTRDYEKELARFNKKNGIDVYKSHDGVPVDIISVKALPQKQVKAPQVNMSNENAAILLKADFLRMTEKERKAFLEWAVQNINS